VQADGEPASGKLKRIPDGKTPPVEQGNMRIEGVAVARKPVQNDLVLPIDAAHDLADSWTS
jgi:hypothetical protein